MTDKTRASLFLDIACNQPHWRNLRPDLITKALLTLGKATSGDRDDFLRALLTKKDSAHHPEWLEVFIKTDQHDYLTLALNQVLALDHWYNNPYLKLITRGAPLSVEALRRADWVPIKEVPKLESAMNEARLRDSSPRAAPNLRLIANPNRCEQVVEGAN